MKHRIRAAAIVVEGDSMLLVKHQGHGPEDGYVWWVPPGGGVEGEESLEECARRETLEETGLSVELGNIVYVREFLEPGLPSLRDILSGELLLRQRRDR